ncbi:aspartate/glutamate racemase family protein [Salinarimonas soli]|uniref:Asp/Glu racemase n=1 Tax=Salinarimonas soli TaxID=1638099 RepID=A0A5B2VBF4_9HYPH|nr:aspartate/glutamate racemase family protein [Salinarimonas soli]KAA2236096.1 Asp/Glu racemase [Salinarimonas soli]
MRILLINPNTTPAVTDLVAAHAGALAPPGVRIDAVTGRFGARYISSRAAAAVAGHAALDALAEHGADQDAVCLACFGDPGLLALKEMSPVPVVGMAEASCQAAAGLADRFAIVTGGVLWGPMLTEFVAALGLSDRLSGVHTVAPTGGEIARDPDGALDMLARACRDAAAAGAGAVVLGGAALAGLAGRIADRVPVPVLCSTGTAVEATIRAAAARSGPVARRAPPVEAIGLSQALTRALG